MSSQSNSDGVCILPFPALPISGSPHEPGSGDTAPDAARLLRIASLAEELDHDQIRNDAREAAERISEGRFYVACVGQFKRGKSTLLNALTGISVLPTGVIPVTTIPTILRFGDRLQARVRVQNGAWTKIEPAEIEEYVSETRNPENAKGVASVELFVPSPLLRDGMCFVDTPGLGSVFAGNTAATHAFVPHIDAAIVVIGADPPIAGDELALVESVAKNVPDILFVLNKADRVTVDERETAISFAREILEKRLRRPVRSVFAICALEQLKGNDCQRDWPDLLESLNQLICRSGGPLVRAAGNRALRRLSSQLLNAIHEERDALARPFNESEMRIAQLRNVISHAEQSLQDLGFLFSSEQQRLSRTFVAQREAFLKSVRPLAHADFRTAIASIRRVRGPRYRRSVMQAAQSIAKNHTLPWLETEQKNAEDAYAQITMRFTHLANEFLIKARGVGSAEMANLPQDLESEQAFRVRSEFHFHEFVELADPASPIRYVADVILGMIFAHLVIASDAHEFLDRLLETNTERVRNDLENRVTESRRLLESEIRGMLQQLSVVAERALARARTAHGAGKAAVDSALQKLAAIEAELARLGETNLEHA
jgi:GTP-binding protein EngB required for normal cell division